MKVPVLNGGPAKSREARPQYSNLDFGDGTNALVQGVGQLSRGVSDVGNHIADKRLAAKAKADAIATDSLFAQAQAFTTEQLHGYNEAPQAKPGPAGYDSLTEADIAGVGAPGRRVAGYLESRGTQAHEQSGPTLDAIQKKYESLLKTAGNEEQRAAARQRMSSLFESVRSQTAQHEGRQFQVAEQAATNGLLSTALDSAATLYNRPDEAFKLTADALASLKRTSLPEEFEAKKAEYLSKVSQSMIGGFLQHGDVVGAAARYGADQEVLGADGERVKAKIDAAMKAGAVHANDVEAQRSVDSMIQLGTNPEGKPDLDQIDSLLLAVKAGPLRDEMVQRLGPAKEMAAKRWKQKVDDYANVAGATYEKTLTLGAIDAKVKTWLIDNAPDEWRKLRHDAEQGVARSRAARSGDAAARREQLEIDRLAKLEWDELTQDEKVKTDVNAFLRGRGVSNPGASVVRGNQTRAKEANEKGDAVGEDSFRARVKAGTQGIVGSDKEKAKVINSIAVEAYEDLRTKANGKPSGPEVDAEVDRLIAKAATAPRVGESIRGKGEEMEIQRLIRERKENGPKPKFGPSAAAKPAIPKRMTDGNGVLREKGADGKWHKVKP